MLRSSFSLLLLLLIASPDGSAQESLWYLTAGAHPNDGLSGVAAAPGGDVFVGGRAVGDLWGPSQGGVDAWIGRYDAAGSQVWAKQLGSAGGDTLSAVEGDGSGGLFACGQTDGSLMGPQQGIVDAWLARFDGDGNPLWGAQLGTPQHDHATRLASDGAGGVFVVGETTGSLAGPQVGGGDVWLARFDGAGNLLWSVQLGSSGYDRVGGLVADGVGGLLVGGDTPGTLGGPPLGGTDLFLARYDASGGLQWIHQTGSPGIEMLTALAPDGSGGCYAGGSQWVTGPSIEQPDAWLGRFDAAGNLLWERRFGTAQDESTWALATDRVGGNAVGVYALGTTRGSLFGTNVDGDRDAWMLRVDAAGAPAWSHQLGAEGDDVPAAAASDGLGGVVAGGSADGRAGPLWLARHAPPLGAVTCSGDGGGSSCPCGNEGASGAGCANSTGAGASLRSAGQPSVASAGQELVAGGLPPLRPGVYLQGSAAVNGGAGTWFGDGLRCAGGSVARLEVRAARPDGTSHTDVDLVAAGGVLAGQTLRYQLWYRDPAGGPCSAGFNLTNAVEVVWQP